MDGTAREQILAVVDQLVGTSSATFTVQDVVDRLATTNTDLVL